jgi:hypothetical protein
MGMTARLGPDRPGPAGRRQHGGHRVPADQQLDRAVAVRPFTMQARTTFALVAPASTRLQLVIDTHARGVVGLLLPLLWGRFRKTIVRSLRLIKEEAEAEASPT